MAKSVPIRDFKNTSEFMAMVEGEAEPVVVTRNGVEALVVMRPADYDGLRLARARAELYAMVLEAEADIAAGTCCDGAKLLDELRGEYGL